MAYSLVELAPELAETQLCHPRRTSVVKQNGLQVWGEASGAASVIPDLRLQEEGRNSPENSVSH